MIIAFATYAEEPGFTRDDAAVVPALADFGIVVEAVPWDSHVDWGRYGAVVVRSTWDYRERYADFLAWVKGLERDGVKLLNPPAIIRENTRKTYLKRLEAAGVPIMPTRFIERGEKTSLESVFAETGWPEIVLKPSVSGGAYRTYRIRREEAGGSEAALAEILVDCEAMVQPFCPQILKEGEYSFLFYGGEFSHALVKRGKGGDFRIQSTFGGTMAPYRAKAAEIAQAQAAIAANSSEALLYARVDMLRDEDNPDRFLLVELEITEPCLFFLNDQANPGAADRFANALKARLT